jgi:hypothetical protein
MPAILTNLAAYIAALAKSADETTRAEDRSAYAQHLAAAARMFLAAHTGQTAELAVLVATERTAYGRSYLSGPAGDAAEQAFAQFAKRVDDAHAA